MLSHKKVEATLIQEWKENIYNKKVMALVNLANNCILAHNNAVENNDKPAADNRNT